MAFTEIAYETDGPVATITLDRPEKLNAFTRVMMAELVDALDQADSDDDVRAVVVTGRGRAFCAGADLSAGGSTFDASERPRAELVGDFDGVPRDGGGIVALRIAAMRKPVIGAINGPAVGVGLTMTLPMDVRMAAESAKFGFVFTRRGLTMEAASSWFLPRIVGISQAVEWVCTGRVFGAEEAKAGRLISDVHPADKLLDAAYALAREIADNTSAVAVAVSRQLLWSMLGADSPWEAHRLDSKAIFQLGRSGDVAEGVTAFLEKRPADFPMRIKDDYPTGIPLWPGPQPTP
ncbi:crotonase/enoyl-CoA hydratase family protein [Fodinicola acaciae]|uniref:crotonase/enoyl-CoA hydratase family protein n=1 Tax=Fodinicola acaciae TaxID=2681555 RepID=UPI0013D1591C|nr:crotonase/enoyl-CoA hydratase family protein [Fodinicola acaciae]